MAINYKKLKKHIHKTSTGYRFDYIVFTGSKTKFIKLISYLINTYPTLEEHKEFIL